MLLVAVAGAALLLTGPEAPPERIVLIVIDTLRRDHVSVYGGLVPTPHIEALAARGQVFENYVAAFHQTTMSMAALFTGRVPSLESGNPKAPLPWNGSTWCGMTRFGDDGTGADEVASDEASDDCIPNTLPTLAEKLRDAGYWTMGAPSNWFLYEPSGFGRGFDDRIEVGLGPPDVGRDEVEMLDGPRSLTRWQRVNRAAIKLLNRRPTNRFFLFVHYMDVHDYALVGIPYAEAVTRADRAVGGLLAALEAAQLLEDSVVILTSDHGERLGDPHPIAHERRGRKDFSHNGNPSYEELLRVPLVIAPPLFDDPGRWLRTWDLHYRILELAGAPDERPVEALGADELLTTERNWWTYQKGRWKSAVHRRSGLLHLFDLESDPRERRNVAQTHPGVTRAHRGRIDALAARLATERAPRRHELSESDRERLEALGYLE